MKKGKASGPSEVTLELVATSEGVGILVMAEIFQSLKDLECYLNGLSVWWCNLQW